MTYTGTGVSGTFAEYYYGAMAEIYDQYGCTADQSAGYKNCTAEELSSLQWGSLGVTNNPKASWGTYYTPKSMTVAMWGN